MGHRTVSTISTSAALLLAALAPALAQSQLPRPGQLPPAGGQAPQRSQQAAPPPAPQAAAAKPYKAVTVAPPAVVEDPSFEAFRKELAAVAEKKDRRALANMVAKNFFWMGDKGDKADKKKPGIDNLAKAIDLDGKEGYGWESLLGYASDPTGVPFQDRKDTMCAPATPGFDDQEFEAMLKATGTEEGDWAFPAAANIELRASAQPNAPVIEKLGMHFIRVLDEDSGNDQMVKVVSPSGKTGFIPADAISPLGNDEICYVKEGNAWKIAGFIGGDE